MIAAAQKCFGTADEHTGALDTRLGTRQLSAKAKSNCESFFGPISAFSWQVQCGANAPLNPSKYPLIAPLSQGYSLPC